MAACPRRLSWLDHLPNYLHSKFAEIVVEMHLNRSSKTISQTADAVVCGRLAISPMRVAPKSIRDRRRRPIRDGSDHIGDEELIDSILTSRLYIIGRLRNLQWALAVCTHNVLDICLHWHGYGRGWLSTLSISFHGTA